MECGRCGGGLEALVERGVEIDRCRPCGVIFFDAGELDRYAGGSLEAGLHRVRDGEAEAELRCNRCDGPMRTVRTGSGAIDACTLCAGVRVIWESDRPPLLDLRPLPERPARRSAVHPSGGGDAAVELLVHAAPALDLPDLDGAGGLVEGAGGLLEGGGELIGGVLGALGEILGALSP